MKRKPKRTLAAPTVLKPFDEEKNSVQAIIETPRGSRNKFAYDDERGVFKLKKVLPEGMTFPHDFGFVPSTRADDGDPADVLILMDEPAYPGCLIECRIVGVVEGQQKEKGEAFRNDRFIGVSVESHTHSNIRDITDLNPDFLKELESFFEQYHKFSGSKYKCLGQKGAKAANRILKAQVVKRAA